MKKEVEPNMEQRILDAAQKLFLDKGFAKTSTTQIAKEADCNQALVHYYFRTKEKLFQKIFESKIRMFASAFLDTNIPGNTFEEKMSNRISRHFDMLSTMPKLPVIILSDMTETEERIVLLKEAMGNVPQEIFITLQKELQAEIKKGAIRPITPQDLILNILSLNVFLFVSMPVFSAVLNLNEDQKQEMIAHRKKEIINTIICSLHP